MFKNAMEMKILKYSCQALIKNKFIQLKISKKMKEKAFLFQTKCSLFQSIYKDIFAGMHRQHQEIGSKCWGKINRNQMGPCDLWTDRGIYMYKPHAQSAWSLLRDLPDHKHLSLLPVKISFQNHRVCCYLEQLSMMLK